MYRAHRAQYRAQVDQDRWHNYVVWSPLGNTPPLGNKLNAHPAVQKSLKGKSVDKSQHTKLPGWQSKRQLWPQSGVRWRAHTLPQEWGTDQGSNFGFTLNTVHISHKECIILRNIYKKIVREKNCGTHRFATETNVLFWSFRLFIFRSTFGAELSNNGIVSRHFINTLRKGYACILCGIN
jgi:hypothetical protein